MFDFFSRARKFPAKDFVSIFSSKKNKKIPRDFYREAKVKN